MNQPHQKDAIREQLAHRVAELEEQLAKHEEDQREAAGALFVDLPKPGTDAAKMLRVIRRLRDERDELAKREAPVAMAARVAHEVNRAYCQALGDDSQPAWQDAPDWQRESAIAGVEFHRANPGAGPEASHNSWSAQKLSDGWRHGEVKDPVAKTHPCLVAFESLPVAQQAKDYLFRAVVHAVMGGGDAV